MFTTFEEFKNFMIFCHTHYELNDVWNKSSRNKGINFEGWFFNVTGNQEFSPEQLDETQRPLHRKRHSLEEIYETWKLIQAKKQ